VKTSQLKQRIYEILEIGKLGDRISIFFDVFLITLIILNVAAIILESISFLHGKYAKEFFIFELSSVVIFTTEYILRAWTITCNPNYQKPVTGRFRYLITPMAIIDLLAILPFYLAALGLDLRVIRIFRLFRIFRFAKLVRYSSALRLLFSVLRNKSAEIGVTVLLMSVLLIVASSLVYYAENHAQPEKFSSIPASMWWGIATLTTVGYGDIAPVTGLGKFFAAIIAVLGIGMFALPAGILGSAFVDAMGKNKIPKHNNCPHCGKNITETTKEDS